MSDKSLKNIFLNKFHQENGAKFVPFAGYEMPINYKKGIINEHLHVREKIGIFDVSHMGEFIISGQKSESFLQSVLSNDVSILKGGIKNWKNCNGAVSSKKTIPKQGDFEAIIERKELVVNLNEMIFASKNNSKLILDARSEKRYLGEAKEPRPGLPSGHIPNSKSLPASDLISSDGYLKSLEELNEYFLDKNINNEDDIIATCGSGVSACVISIALYCLGKEDVPIYDGSWTEWALSGQKIGTSV